MTTNFHIRAEFEDQTFSDFQVSAEDRIAAQMRAEVRIRQEKRLTFSTKFDWHGMVVFVHPESLIEVNAPER